MFLTLLVMRSSCCACMDGILLECADFVIHLVCRGIPVTMYSTRGSVVDIRKHIDIHLRHVAGVDVGYRVGVSISDHECGNWSRAYKLNTLNQVLTLPPVIPHLLNAVSIPQHCDNVIL